MAMSSTSGGTGKKEDSAKLSRTSAGRACGVAAQWSVQK
jgi:hypothetical protein